MRNLECASDARPELSVRPRPFDHNGGILLNSRSSAMFLVGFRFGFRVCLLIPGIKSHFAELFLLCTRVLFTWYRVW